MDTFQDSHKFDRDEDGTFIHTRSLGIKQGYLYPEATWADVTIHNVDIHDSMYWIYRNECLEEISSREKGEVDPIIVGEKDVDCSIKYSVGHLDFEKASNEKKKYFRKRLIPKNKTKKFPVKPITDERSVKMKKLERYSELSGERVYSCEDTGNSVYSGIIINRDFFKEGYGVHNLKDTREEVLLNSSKL